MYNKKVSYCYKIQNKLYYENFKTVLGEIEWKLILKLQKMII